MQICIHHDSTDSYPWQCVVIGNADDWVSAGQSLYNIHGDITLWCMEKIGGDDWCMTERIWHEEFGMDKNKGRAWFFRKQEDAVLFHLTWG